MAFITGSDEISTIEIILFPKTLEQYKVEKGDIILVNGKVEKRFDSYQLICNKLKIVKE